MNKAEKYFNKRLLLAVLLCASMVLISSFVGNREKAVSVVYDSNYGNFLAAQHAIYTNDFVSASKFMSAVQSDKQNVINTKILVGFLNGTISDDVVKLKNDKSISGRLVYDAYLIKNSKWQELYNRHSKEDSNLLAPLRIFSAVKLGKITEAEKYIKNLKTSDS